ncbi:MAG: Inositol-3-phosphate synthase [Candidatus Heimdallarchaeota archaeon LC_3]|nr:MAG: Inositol-3-phosphate synthase [Candidatus Heimdallarchaeota archaeon LC_3]
MSEVRVAVVGVGNATSAFLQALGYYSSPQGAQKEKFLSFLDIGGLSIADINIVTAFDIAKGKVGKPINQAIFSLPNVTKRYVDDSLIDNYNVIVQKGPVMDGINPIAASAIQEDDNHEIDVVDELKKANAEVVVCLLPSGAKKAVEFYADAALKAECAFINATPADIASSRKWALKFKRAGLPLVGDDLQSLLGGTRIHKGILEVLSTFGAEIVHTYNLDVSGGSEALITLDSGYRIQKMKSKIKSESIRKINPHLKQEDVVTGTTDYLDFLGSLRIGHFWIKVKDFLGGDIHIDLTVKTDDGPNAAGTLVDVVRATKIALARTIDGPVTSISAYGFKNPPQYVPEAQAKVSFKEFIRGLRNN